MRGPLLSASFALFVVVSCAPRDARPGAPGHAVGESAAGSRAKAEPSASPGRDDDLFASRGHVVIDAPSGPLRFSVELALTDRERQHGLMYREHLDDDAGMLFIFERPRVQSFWMKNTRIPLDMIFIGEGGEIVGIVESAEPLTLTARRVDGPSRYVLELNGGATRKLGITAGQRVHFEGVPAELVDPGVLSAASSTTSSSTPPSSSSPASPPPSPGAPAP